MLNGFFLNQYKPNPFESKPPLYKTLAPDLVTLNKTFEDVARILSNNYNLQIKWSSIFISLEIFGNSHSRKKQVKLPVIHKVLRKELVYVYLFYHQKNADLCSKVVQGNNNFKREKKLFSRKKVLQNRFNWDHRENFIGLMLNFTNNQEKL